VSQFQWLIRREPLPARRLPRIGRLSRDLDGRAYAVLARVSPGCPPHKVRSLTCYAPVRHSTRVRRPGLVRLACVKHAASVRPEPGSNSPKRFRTAPDERLIVYKRSEFSVFWIPFDGRKQCLPRAIQSTEPRFSISLGPVAHLALEGVRRGRGDDTNRETLPGQGVVFTTRDGLMHREGIEPSTLGLRVPCSAN
jgi:hypothetical protein